MGAGAATSALAQPIGNALNLDTFEVVLRRRRRRSAGDARPADRAEPVRESGAGDRRRQSDELRVERLLKWLRLRTNVLQGTSTQQQLFQRMQGSGADLLFFFSY
jgi:hypothetical protein